MCKTLEKMGTKLPINWCRISSINSDQQCAIFQATGQLVLGVSSCWKSTSISGWKFQDTSKPKHSLNIVVFFYSNPPFNFNLP